MTLSPSSESATHLGHYDLIADVFDELDISDLIDTLLLGSSQTHCQIKGYFFLFPLTKTPYYFPKKSTLSFLPKF